MEVKLKTKLNIGGPAFSIEHKQLYPDPPCDLCTDGIVIIKKQPYTCPKCKGTKTISDPRNWQFVPKYKGIVTGINVYIKKNTTQKIPGTSTQYTFNTTYEIDEKQDYYSYNLYSSKNEAGAACDEKNIAEQLQRQKNTQQTNVNK